MFYNIFLVCVTFLGIMWIPAETAIVFFLVVAMPCSLGVTASQILLARTCK